MALLSNIKPKEIKYHGSPYYFDKIDLRYSSSEKDFGVGFYLGESFKDARNWALKHNRNQGYVYSYHVPYSLIRGLNIKTFNGTSIPWLDFIISNRKVVDFKHNYDVVIGPIADARTVRILDDYIEGKYGNPNSAKVKADVIRILQQKDLGIQYCFCTQRAVDLIQDKRIDVKNV